MKKLTDYITEAMSGDEHDKNRKLQSGAALSIGIDKTAEKEQSKQ